MTSHEPIAISISEAAQLSGRGRSFIYQAIGRGELPMHKAGKSSFIFMSDLRHWLEKFPRFTPLLGQGPVVQSGNGRREL
jgi:excisionase family DNA binding protein